MMNAHNKSPQDSKKNVHLSKSNFILKPQRLTYDLLVGSVLCVLIMIVIATRISMVTTPSRTIFTNHPGVMIQQSYDGALPLKPIDQDRYQKIIQKSWDEALVKGSTNIVNFPNDPNLVAFSYKPSGSTAAQSFVLYRNKPITIKTKKVLELTGNVSSRITLSSQNYALVVMFEYTPDVQELNIEPVLKDTFEAMVRGRSMM